ncbi:hypothetical protein PV328_009859 [Microctonus aethiopoides]|uniref:Probable Ufm1-specific protease 2 n=1 Tax=Microctonus aethiopoides TaxID=144406 RepID=A0AA39C712_9HYME|nr:hypothetical protein PV328_009859 [Microctonus aethiopoides]
MPPKVRISSTMINKLKDLTSNNTGRLFGVMSDNSLTVLSFALNPSPDDEDVIKPTELQLNMPAEIDLCGILCVGECQEDIPNAFKDIDITDNPLLIKYSLENNHVLPYYYIHEKLMPAPELEIISEAEIWQRFSYIRLRTSLPMVTQKCELTEAFQTTRKNIASGSVGFHFPDSDVFLLGNDSESREISTRELANKSFKNIPGYIDVIDVTMFMRMTNELSRESELKYAPVLQQIKRPFESLQFDLNVDTLSLVGNNLTATQLYSILVEAVCRSLRLLERSLMQQLDNDLLNLPEIMHFKPKSFVHFITIPYPTGISSEDMKRYRKKLHKLLAFDLSRPCFKRGNAVKFARDYKPNDLILQPHKAIKSTLAGQTHISIVDGLYAYHHYQQDSFNDSGWGCAYRSLQTIFSWFRLQGYTDQPIPTHRTIQKCLVDIGDKPPNFIGSNQWIGSTEVGFVLETLLGITVRVLCAATGNKMTDLNWNLKEHFDTQGIPVMIGGGVLAHTILGIRYNENTKETQWLILDPHYEGTENLSTIVNRGWCGWKNEDFWKKDAFYNMCLPQKPSCF